MDFITWCGLFKIGHPIIDEQHQQLIRIANIFHNELQKRGKELIPDILNNLIKYMWSSTLLWAGERKTIL